MGFLVDQSWLITHVNYENGKLYLIKKWNQSGKLKINNEIGYFDNSTGYYAISIYGKKYKIHRLIFLYHHGFFPREVDHIDGNSSNNRIENLRAANRAENARNSKLSISNKLKLKGVYYHSRDKK